MKLQITSMILCFCYFAINGQNINLPVNEVHSLQINGNAFPINDSLWAVTNGEIYQVSKNGISLKYNLNREIGLIRVCYYGDTINSISQDSTSNWITTILNTNNQQINTIQGKHFYTNNWHIEDKSDTLIATYLPNGNSYVHLKSMSFAVMQKVTEINDSIFIPFVFDGNQSLIKIDKNGIIEIIEEYTQTFIVPSGVKGLEYKNGVFKHSLYEYSLRKKTMFKDNMYFAQRVENDKFIYLKELDRTKIYQVEEFEDTTINDISIWTNPSNNDIHSFIYQNDSSLVVAEQGKISVYANITSSRQQLLSEKSINLFPNPTREYIYIETETFDIQDIEIVDNQGKIVKVINKYMGEKVTVTELNSGIYWVKISDENTKKSQTLKLIIQK